MLYNTAERPSSATFAELVESLCLETRLFLFLTVALIFPKEVRCSKLLRVFGGPDVVTTSRGPEGSLHMNRKPQPPTPEMQSICVSRATRNPTCAQHVAGAPTPSTKYSETLEPRTVSGLFTVVCGRKVHGGFWVAASEPGLRE
eukprot:s4652_g2.t1